MRAAVTHQCQRSRLVAAVAVKGFDVNPAVAACGDTLALGEEGITRELESNQVRDEAAATITAARAKTRRTPTRARHTTVRKPATAAKTPPRLVLTRSAQPIKAAAPDHHDTTRRSRKARDSASGRIMARKPANWL